MKQTKMKIFIFVILIILGGYLLSLSLGGLCEQTFCSDGTNPQHRLFWESCPQCEPPSAIEQMISYLLSAFNFVINLPYFLIVFTGIKMGIALVRLFAIQLISLLVYWYVLSCFIDLLIDKYKRRIPIK